MKHKIWFDDAVGACWMELVGTVTAGEMSDMLEQCHQLLKDKSPRHLITDHTESPEGVSRAVRKVLEEEAPKVNADKHAFIGTKASNRMLAKIIIAIIGKSKNTKFFKTKEEAFAWFKGA